jgi:FkbM family methyltransferase
LGGFLFHCDLRDAISREVCFTGRYEPQETALLQAVLGPGMTFVDVGAHWGYHTLLAAFRVGPLGRVLSLEPDSRCFAVLRDNIAINELAQVRALPLAAADRPGLLNMTGYEDAGGNSGLSKVTALEDGKATSQVAAQPLDYILESNGIAHVDLLKMDIEGAEELALLGLQASLKQGKVRRLLIELHPQLLRERGRTTAQVLELLTRHGYRGWRIDHSPLMTRRAAYARDVDLASLVLPLDAGSPLDAWPHMLWVAPGSQWLP